MNEEQYLSLTNGNADPKVTILDLSLIKTEGTLIYGYTLARDTFHLYVKNNFIHLCIYDGDNKVIDYEKGREFDLRLCIPNKRVYPAASDYNFCEWLMRRGVEIPFTTWEYREPCLFYGKVYEELGE